MVLFVFCERFWGSAVGKMTMDTMHGGGRWCIFTPRKYFIYLFLVGSDEFCSTFHARGQPTCEEREVAL